MPSKSETTGEFMVRVGRERGDRAMEAMGLGTMGYEASSSDPNKGIELYLQSMAMRRDIGDQGGVAFAYCKIGEIYDMRLNNKQKALEYFKLAVQNAADEDQVEKYTWYKNLMERDLGLR